MKRVMKLLAVPFIVCAGVGITSCSPSSSGTGGEFTLRILNSEDYIYIQEDKNDPIDMVDQFIQWVKTSDDERCIPFRDKNVKVVYDCSDTNETIYSELMTGKSNYDLINVSDYMAQKIVSNGYAVPIINNDDYPDWTEIPNYENYASKNIKNRLDNIIATQKKYDEDEHKWKDVEVALKDYAVGYMWGTLGILFNPYFNTGITPTSILDDIEMEGNEKLLQVINDMMEFDALWNTNYKGTITIKNSMRDTFAMALLYAYRDEFQAIRDLYLDGTIDTDEYLVRFDEIFSRCEQKDVDAVYDVLTTLKGNIFGLEVDSGKQDIVTSKIGINLAWSGDAVYSMDQANDPEQVGDHLVDLCYAVPQRGTNLWFDTWIMPNCPRSEAQGELARLFLDFMCDPVNASQNMNYTGYTSFIGGDSIIELVRDWYDIRTEEVFYYDEEEDEYYDIYRIDEALETFEYVGYNDCVSYNENEDYGHLDEFDDEKLYYFVPFEDETILEEDNMVLEPRSFEELMDNGDFVPADVEDELDAFELEEEITPKLYGDLWLADLEGYEEVDLTYFFEETCEEYEACDFLFYSDCYLPFETEDGDQNIAVGRQFFCQYPDQEVFNRSAVMKDYGENNKLVMRMWENFKSNPLPTGSIIVFIVIIAALLALVIYFLVNNMLKRRLHNIRVKNK